jgi:hypothetical protein
LSANDKVLEESNKVITQKRSIVRVRLGKKATEAFEMF